MRLFLLCFFLYLGVFSINYDDVKDDLIEVLNSAPTSWEDSNYSGFFIRLAWHCAGTYRTSDGRGGCDGARIRFAPELHWGSNIKLNEALELIEPIKIKYGSELSWGDLIILAGNVAIENTGGPQLTFCGGRVDVYNGDDSETLNEHIYLDAEIGNFSEVRSTFDIMDMNDQETTVLIGGGHAWGRCHNDVSGFEGPWTHSPTQFSNSYFKNLLNEDWVAGHSGAGRTQYWNEDQSLMMLNTDMEMLLDSSYLHWVEFYADDDNYDQLLEDFGRAWEKLTNRDFGNMKCHYEEPEVIENDYTFTWREVREDVRQAIENDGCDDGFCGGLFVRLAWHCAGTYRITDHRGGCNGARIRHDPEINWGSNINLDFALEVLEPIYNAHDDLSWADLIVIAGTTALEEMGAPEMSFCPGRYDVEDGSGSAYLNENIYLDAEIGTADDIRATMSIMGFTEREIVALNGGGHSVGRCHADVSGFEGPWTFTPEQFGNSFFKLLLERTWVEEISPAGKLQYTQETIDNTETALMMLHTDLELKLDPVFRAIVVEFAGDEELFREEFAAAWVKLMNADRFNDVCYEFERRGACSSYNGQKSKCKKHDCHWMDRDALCADPEGACTQFNGYKNICKDYSCTWNSVTEECSEPTDCLLYRDDEQACKDADHCKWRKETCKAK